MRIAIASDHAGLDLKETVADFVRHELGCQIDDLGTHSRESCDFPDYAVRVARAVVSEEADLGILICGAGIGMSVAANKVSGIVAALCSEPYSARVARAHNDANVLCLGGRVIGPELAKDVVRVFLTADRDESERHARRRSLVSALDCPAEMDT